ncbi:MAG: FG-GAP-like repeat-containing protein, partial [Verrucomicrobiae bacterium]|nr:FG-GAP-like repeat-containing protein [Verrucomicrobiae bacterium]
FWNRGDGTYAEIANFAGVAATDWTWHPAFLDVDLDGFEDLLIVNGMLHDVQDRDVLAKIQSLGPQQPEQARTNLLLYPPFLTPNFACRNKGNLTFENMSKEWGFDSHQISQGMAFADFDRDGDMDIVINCLNDLPLLLRNDAGMPRVAVRLKGKPPNTHGIGAIVIVKGGAVPVQSQEILSGGRYLSSDEPMRVFAAGSATNLVIEVIWRNGQRTFFDRAQPNRVYEFDETAAEVGIQSHQATVSKDQNKGLPPSGPSSDDEESGPKPWFKDVTETLGHKHHEVFFNDYARQPLLTKQLSALGPGIAFVDLDNDARDELVIGTGRGGDIAVYRWSSETGFRELAPEKKWQAFDDLTGMTLWTAPDGARALLIGLANYESGATNGPMLLELRVVNGVPRLSAYVHPDLRASGSSPGPISSTDIDGNGVLDLFVGMRVVPGAYPTAGGSVLY